MEDEWENGNEEQTRSSLVIERDVTYQRVRFDLVLRDIFEFQIVFLDQLIEHLKIQLILIDQRSLSYLRKLFVFVDIVDDV